MMRYPLFLIAACCFVSFAAQESIINCEGLQTLSIPGCENESLFSPQKSGCRARRYLEAFVEYVTMREKPCSLLVADVETRSAFFRDTTTVVLDTSGIQWIGADDASVTIIMYISMSCPFCKQVYAQLYDSLHSAGNGSSRVRVGVKNFTTRKYDRILAASSLMGKQPEFLRAFANIGGRMTDDMVRRISDSIHVSYDTLMSLTEDTTIIAMVERSHKEGVALGVKVVPAVFINNHVYNSYKSAHWMLDAARYEAGRCGTRKKSCQKANNGNRN